MANVENLLYFTPSYLNLVANSLLLQLQDKLMVGRLVPCQVHQKPQLTRKEMIKSPIGRTPQSDPQVIIPCHPPRFTPVPRPPSNLAFITPLPFRPSPSHPELCFSSFLATEKRKPTIHAIDMYSLWRRCFRPSSPSLSVPHASLLST